MYSSVSAIAPMIMEMLKGTILGEIVIEQIIILVLYNIYFAYTLQVIALKNNIEHSWLAWIPIVRSYILWKMCNRPIWFLVLIITFTVIPYLNMLFINTILLTVLWMDISEHSLGNKWLGILAVTPIINIGFIGYLAFYPYIPAINR